MKRKARIQYHRLKNKRKYQLLDQFQNDLFWFSEFCNFVDAVDRDLYDTACQYANQMMEKDEK
jgi:hypothetical protein